MRRGDRRKNHGDCQAKTRNNLTVVFQTNPQFSSVLPRRGQREIIDKRESTTAAGSGGAGMITNKSPATQTLRGFFVKLSNCSPNSMLRAASTRMASRL